MPWPWVQYPVRELRFCKTGGAAGEEKKCTLVSSSILGRLFNFSRLRRNPTPALLATLSASAGVFPWGNTLCSWSPFPGSQGTNQQHSLPYSLVLLGRHFLFSWGTIRPTSSIQLSSVQSRQRSWGEGWTPSILNRGRWKAKPREAWVLVHSRPSWAQQSSSRLAASPRRWEEEWKVGAQFKILFFIYPTPNTAPAPCWPLSEPQLGVVYLNVSVKNGDWDCGWLRPF